MVLGITGMYCSGKSTASQILKKLGFIEISVDKLGHDALQQKKQEIIATFGKKILSHDTHTIDRKKLGAIVFSSPSKLTQLEDITHPWMKEQIINTIQKDKEQKWIIDAALLYKMDLHKLCTQIIIVHCPAIIRFFRALKRDKINSLQILQRFYRQKNIIDKEIYKRAKKTLNQSYISSEQLVIGTCSLTVFEEELIKIIKGARHGRNVSYTQR